MASKAKVINLTVRKQIAHYPTFIMNPKWLAYIPCGYYKRLHSKIPNYPALSYIWQIMQMQ